MTAECNREYAHALLRGSETDGEGVRYNLTFRCMQGAGDRGCEKKESDHPVCAHHCWSAVGDSSSVSW